MADTLDSTRLTERVTALVEAARKAGADAADAVAVRGRSSSVTMRMGKVESTESAESDDVSLRVFVGRRVASVSATASSDAAALAERAVAMARVAPEDPFQSLADPALLVKKPRDLDLFDSTQLSAAEMKADALAMEEAALAVPGVTNSAGSSVASGLGGLVLATSAGLVAQYVASRFTRSISVIAGEGTGMERDYDYSSRLHFSDLDAPGQIGRQAGTRAVGRLNPRKAETGPVTVVFDPRVARGLAGHLAGAINGAAVARKTSFLRDMMGKKIAADAITVTDEPLRPRGQSSRPFDGEGVEGEKLEMVTGGVLNHWFLSTSAALELGLTTNGRGVRASSSVTPSSTNLAIEPGSISPGEMIRSVKSGFYVTEVFGQGVNMVTGEYSRGASGFWIDGGELAYPVSEVTIASNLKDMFLNLVPANDLDRNYGTAAPTLLVEGMTLAGR
ncbi:MAG: TldD/PmbA family protein [Rhizobiales bacterium]|nr:TldD/PmbA family protein [Hyphomicrobiales bacterium]